MKQKGAQTYKKLTLLKKHKTKSTDQVKASFGKFLLKIQALKFVKNKVTYF